MSTLIKLSFPNGSFNDVITISPASVTNNSARESTALSNATNLDLDALVQAKIKTGASGTSSTGYINLWVYASADNGTTYPDNVTGTDANITLVNPNNLVWLGSFNCVANATTYKSPLFSVASKFGGILPVKWGIVIENKTGGTLDSTAGNHAVTYLRVQGQTV